MYYLGISDSHLSHACLFKDGMLIGAIAEERLTRRKAEMGFPINSIKFLLEEYRLGGNDISNVFIAGEKGLPFIKIYRRDVNFSVENWVEQNEEYFHPKLMKQKKLTAIDDFNMFKHVNQNLNSDPLYPFIEKYSERLNENPRDLLEETYAEILERELNIQKEKISFYRHEDCHKAYGLFSSPEKFDECIILTCEGGGDDSSATVSVLRDGQVNEIWASNNCSLGRLYRNATIFLGMKPGQDEYKVMGLAPYASPKNGQKALEFFREIDKVDGLSVERLDKHPDLFYAMKKGLKGIRFDGVAWGLQTYLEETLLSWMNNAIEATGIRNVIFSGGVAQNIKAMKILAESQFVDQFWVGPVTGDGSLGIGAAILGMSAKHNVIAEQLSTPYLGTTAADDNLSELITSDDPYTVLDYSPSKVGQLIEASKIVATCRGKSEFGMRALGNRSILADPRTFGTIDRINEKVKLRDFWMPFTPSFMEDKVNDYIIRNSCAYSPYMTMAFDTVPQVRNQLSAVMHPRDKSVRPQFVKRCNNEKYYDEINSFYKISGVPAVLNTSFNLHGEPIVETLEQALDVLGRCEIDALVTENHILVRK